jgi:uncharacterized protein YegP (UPF0339 family)
MAECTTIHLFPSRATDGSEDASAPMWYWHAKGGNGEIVAAAKQGEGSEEEARLQLEDLVDALWDNVEPEYAQDSAGEWRWSLLTDDTLRGRSSEGFVDQRNAQENFELAKTMLTRRLTIVVRDAADA